MTAITHSLLRLLPLVCLGAILLGHSTDGMAQAPIVQPGAPGDPARELSADEAIEIADSRYSPADVRFMQDMIPHHHQAIEMAAFVGDRTNRQELLDVAGRINASQGDEIAFMQTWLGERGEQVPDPTEHDAMHTDHKMAGMATAEQMAELAQSEGTAFDRLFLQLMITHHDGAVTMVEELLDQPGSAYEPVLFEFTTDVTNDQTAEIERMNVLLVGLSTDPRARLKAGFDDADQALLNMELVASLPRAPGFFDPNNPAELPASRLWATNDDDKQVADGETAESEDESEEEDDEDQRYPLLSFSNTDIAFRDDVMVAGSYHGSTSTGWPTTACRYTPRQSSARAGRVTSPSSVTF